MNIGWTTTSTYEDAEKIAQGSVEQKLATCAQIEGPVRSFYTWKGQVENEQEYRITFKFLAKNGEKLESWIKEHHPYDIPQWVTVRAEHVLPAYLSWAIENDLPSEDKTVNLDKAVELSKMATELLRKKSYKEAEKTFIEALELDGANPYVLVGLGDLYREIKQFKDAIGFYEKVLTFDPENVFALRGVGDAYRGLEEPRQAVGYWKRYLECNKNDIHVMTRLADSFQRMGDLQQSELYYREVLEIDGNDKYALLGLGNLYYKMGKNEEALRYLETLIELDESYVAALTMIGNIYRRQKEFDRAVLYYERVIKRNPSNTFALYGLGDSHRGLKNYEEAIRWWLKILGKEPDNQDLLSRIGDALLNLDKMDEALEYYQRSCRIGYDAYALLGMSKIYRQRGNHHEAEQFCRQALEKNPTDRRFLEELADVLEAKGDLKKSEEIRSALPASRN